MHLAFGGVREQKESEETQFSWLKDTGGFLQVVTSVVANQVSKDRRREGEIK